MQVLQETHNAQRDEIVVRKESDEMGETAKTEKTPKKSWSEGLKAEYNKIVWPDKKSLTKQTAAVVVLSVVLGVIITVVDFLVQYGVDFIVK